MLAQVKAYLYAGIALVILGLAATIWIQGVRIDKLKAGLAQEKLNKEACLYANDEGMKTIAELKAERDKAGASCARRLADKQAVIDELNRIDAAKGGGNGARTGDGNAVVVSNTNDSRNTLIDLLNGMLSGAGGRQDGVCQAAGAGVSAGTKVVSGDVLYCLDEVNAKNLMKDFALCKGWGREGAITLDGMR